MEIEGNQPLLDLEINHSFASAPSSREELVKDCLENGTRLVQAIADALFNFPSREDIDGPIVTLPEPTTRLPREKHPPTKWEEFAKKKVMKNRKREGVLPDGHTGTWKRRRGYGRVNDVPILEAKMTDVTEPGQDPLLRERKTKSIELQNREEIDLQNLKEAAKDGVLPRKMWRKESETQRQSWCWRTVKPAP